MDLNSWKQVEAICEYRMLDGKRALGLSLSRSETAQLAVLKRRFETPHLLQPEPYLDRVGERVVVSARIDLIAPGQVVVAELRNLSTTGCYAITAAKLSQGDRVVVTLRSPDGDRAIQVPSTVGRVDRTGAGLRFVGLPVVLHARLDRAA